MALDPALLEPVAGLAALDMREGRPDAARARVEQRLAKTPRDSAALVLAARVWTSLNDPGGAEQFLRRAIEVDDGSFEAYARLGQLLVGQGKLDQALLEYDRLSAKLPGLAGPPTMAALILQSQGKHGEARTRFERIVEADPQAAVASNNLAYIYASAGEQLDRALQLAQTAKSRFPDSPEIDDTLGFVYVKKQLPSLALPPLRRAVEKVPGNPEFHYHLGLAHSLAGDKPAARQAFEQALRLKSDFAGADEARKLITQLQ
jgi:tetratricopeptide (TPR) repeat protein